MGSMDLCTLSKTPYVKIYHKRGKKSSHHFWMTEPFRFKKLTGVGGSFLISDPVQSAKNAASSEESDKCFKTKCP